MTAWMARGLCNDFAGDVEFVPDPFLGQSSRPAKHVCDVCPVREQCRAHHNEVRGLGVVGGEDEADYVVRRGTPVLDHCDCGGTVVATGLGSVCTACGKVTE